MPPSRRRGRPVDPYLCSGTDSPVRCGNCGGHLTASVHQRGKTYEDSGEVRRHYRCMQCGKVIADQRTLDAAIGERTLGRLTQPDQLATIRAVQAERAQKRLPHEAEIARREGLRPYWDGRLNDGLINEEQHAASVAGLDAGIVAARRALEELDAHPAPDLDSDMIRQIVRGWSTATPAQRRADLRLAWRGYLVKVAPGPSTELRADIVQRQISAPERITPPR